MCIIKINFMKDGGEVAGKGSYGIVYVNPRPNCQGEKKGERNDQAGKVFFKKDEENRYIGKKHALEEMHSFQQIKKRFPHSMKTIKKYTILPEKKCLIQHKKLPTDQKWYMDKKKDHLHRDSRLRRNRHDCLRKSQIHSSRRL